MAAYGWGKSGSVKDWLFAEGNAFDFFQAVRLLEGLSGTEDSLATTADPRREAVRITSRVGLEFPASDIFQVLPQAPGEPAEIVVNFLGLAGCLGPLPIAETERIIERIWRKDTSLRDFLDIFNHRLVSLMYRTRRTFHIGLDHRSPEHGSAAPCLYSLVGLGTDHLKGRLHLQDRALLYYAGLLSREVRSLGGLEGILSHYFQIQVRGHQFLGQWLHLDEDQWTAIGRNGRNNKLGGSSTVLGRRSWDQEGRFELELGPLTLRRFLAFLPIENSLASLVDLTRFYVGPTLTFDFTLILNSDEIPESRLAAKRGPRLGWTSWLKTREWEGGDATVKLSPESMERTRSSLAKHARLSIQPGAAQPEAATAQL